MQGSCSDSPAGAPSTQSPALAEQDLFQGHTQQFRKAKRVCTHTLTRMHTHTHTHPLRYFLDPPSSATALLLGL